MDDFFKIILQQYLGGEWDKFVAFCEEHGVSADDIYDNLKITPNDD